MKHRALAAVALAAATLAAGAAHADSYPSKQIKLIIPFAPGGTTDIIGRAAAERMSRALGQSVVVENKAGSGGSVGAAAIARAAPDGYTIGMSTVSTMAVNPACNPKLPYDPIADFRPITNLANVANVIAVNPSFPAKDYKELVALLRANPGKYSYASSGTCGFGHMLGEQFKVSTKTQMNHMPYRGAGPALKDVVAGQVPIMVDNLPSSMPLIEKGQLRPIVISWPKRLESLPNVPTFAEFGLKEPNDPVWYGLVAPANTPDAVIRRLNDAAVMALRDPSFLKILKENGAEPSGNSPAAHAAEIRKEFEKMRALVKAQNIKPDE